MVGCGWRRRSVGDPGLKMRMPSADWSSGMWEWPNTTSWAAGKRLRSRAGRPLAGPLSWIIAIASPARTIARVSGAPRAATSGPSLLPRTARTGA
jgi:hypothetical protein